MKAAAGAGRGGRVGSAKPARGFASALRAARRDSGMSLRALSECTGISESHLSRIERGERTSLSKQSLAALVDATGWHGLWSAAGCVPPDIEQELARLAGELGEAALRGQAVRALRRLFSADCARRFLARHDIPERDMRVDIRAAAAISGLSVSVEYVPGSGSNSITFGEGGAAEVRVGRDTPGATILLRFLYAHALGHRILDHGSCAYPMTNGAEEEATDIACLLLMPDSLVERAVRRSMIGHDPWDPAGGDPVSGIASALAVPLWVAVRRLSDHQTLETDAEAAA